MPKVPKRHQREALVWSAGIPTPAFFMEMRLGKSFTLLRWLRQLRNNPHSLIVCPLSVVPSWVDECIDEGIQWYDVSSWNTARLSAIEAGRKGVYITNYDSLVERSSSKSKPRLTRIGAANWSCVALDESPRIKSPKAKLTKAVLANLKPKYRALLSGMPDPEGISDFVTQMIWLRGSFMDCTNFWQWRAEYCAPSYTGAWVPKKGVTRLAVDAVRSQSFIMTRKQAGLSSTKIRETVHVSLPAKIYKQINNAIDNFEVGDTHASNSALAAFMWAQKLASGVMEGYEHTAKVSELLRLVKHGELNKEPVVVMCRFNKQVGQIENALKRAKISVVSVIGKTKNRREVIESFRKGRARIIVAQIKCVKEGMDFSRASTTIFMSNYHQYGDRAQAEDRTFHPEKRDSALIIDVVAKDTPDEYIPDILKHKGLNAKTFQKMFLEALANGRRND